MSKGIFRCWMTWSFHNERYREDLFVNSKCVALRWFRAAGPFLSVFCRWHLRCFCGDFCWCLRTRWKGECSLQNVSRPLSAGVRFVVWRVSPNCVLFSTHRRQRCGPFFNKKRVLFSKSEAFFFENVAEVGRSGKPSYPPLWFFLRSITVCKK